MSEPIVLHRGDVIRIDGRPWRVESYHRNHQGKEVVMLAPCPPRPTKERLP